jgi:hypothetical protein
MKTLEPRQDFIDPQLQDYLDLLKSVPERDPQAKTRSRAKFLNELDEYFPQAQPVHGPSAGWAAFVAKLRSRLTIQPISRVALVTLSIILLISVVLFGGATATASASKAALPGDRLYPLKTGLEQARLSITSNPAAQANLYMEIASRRLLEIQVLAAGRRFEAIEPLAYEFQAAVKKSLEAVNLLAASDPLQAAQLKAQINLQLAQFAQALNLMLEEVPISIQGSVQQAITTTTEEEESTPTRLISPANENNDNKKSSSGSGSSQDTNTSGSTGSDAENQDGVSNSTGSGDPGNENSGSSETTGSENNSESKSGSNSENNGDGSINQNNNNTQNSSDESNSGEDRGSSSIEQNDTLPGDGGSNDNSSQDNHSEGGSNPGGGESGNH